jgi:hypothetical protein
MSIPAIRVNLASFFLFYIFHCIYTEVTLQLRVLVFPATSEIPFTPPLPQLYSLTPPSISGDISLNPVLLSHDGSSFGNTLHGE